uniref:Uncharacterized protein n=1 Tax=Arundo donax TaxID=35708 RepID=A0A0A9GUP3_ARUDO
MKKLPPAEPIQRLPDDLIQVEHPEYPGRVRALEDRFIAADTKFCERDAEIHRRFALKGYADIELLVFSDDDEDMAVQD